MLASNDHPSTMTIRPIPDPTILTSRAVDDAKEELRRETTLRIEILEARLNASDKAIVLLQTMQDRLPGHMASSVSHSQELMDQRFKTQDAIFDAINRQFTSLDARTEQDRSAAKEAVATALQAAKEAVAAAFQAAKEVIAAQNSASTSAILKSETSTDKRIDEAIRAANAATAALDARITVLAEGAKNIMTRAEVQQLFATVMDKIDGPTGLAMRLENNIARTSGRDEQARQNTGQNQWIIGAVIGGIGILIAVAALMKTL